MVNLASTLTNVQQWTEVETLLRAALGTMNDIFGPKSPATLNCRTELASVLSHEGRIPEATNLLESVVEISTKVLGTEHTNTSTLRKSRQKMKYT